MSSCFPEAKCGIIAATVATLPMTMEREKSTIIIMTTYDCKVHLLRIIHQTKLLVRPIRLTADWKNKTVIVQSIRLTRSRSLRSQNVLPSIALQRPPSQRLDGTCELVNPENWWIFKIRRTY